MVAVRKKYMCRHEDGEHHNCQYVDQVNALIPVADRLAKTKAYDLHPTDIGDRKLAFHRFFHQEMDRLCEEKGLRRRGPRPS